MATNIRIKLLRRKDLPYPQLNYQIIGILFAVYNQLGYGYDEKVYQKAVALSFKEVEIRFREQVYMPIIFKENKIGRKYFDFLVEDKLVLEIKKGDRFAKSHIDQLYEYLKSSNIKLGILAYFALQKLHFKRLINDYSYIRNDS